MVHIFVLTLCYITNMFVAETPKFAQMEQLHCAMELIQLLCQLSLELRQNILNAWL